MPRSTFTTRILDPLETAADWREKLGATGTDDLDGKASAADLTAHISSTSNPHSVTAAQAGAAAVTGFTAMTVIEETDYAALSPPEANTVYFVIEDVP